MTDYIEREAALDRIREYIEEYGEPEENGLHNLKWCAMMEAQMVLTDLPAADVREVVLCKDCKCYQQSSFVDNHMECTRSGFPVHSVDFCSRGEKREEI